AMRPGPTMPPRASRARCARSTSIHHRRTRPEGANHETCGWPGLGMIILPLPIGAPAVSLCAARHRCLSLIFSPSDKESSMLKRAVIALSMLAAVGTAAAAAPSHDEVKQALFDRYATAQGGE